MGGGEILHQNNAKAPAVLVNGSTKYTTIGLGEETLTAMASLLAKTDNDSSTQRANLDLICVIDRSGSMAGAKLNLVKQTMQFVLRQLRPVDRFSLVSYDTNVTTDLPLTNMDPKGIESASKVVDALKAGSCTNLSGGLFEGLSLVDNRTNPAAVCSVLLFTDGLANEGISDKAALQTALTKRLVKTTNASIYTFGFGSDHDASMLQMVAEAGRGLYYFIEDTDKIPLAFADALGGLQSVVAQNIKLHITAVADSGIVLRRVFNSKYRLVGQVPAAAGTKVTIELGDMFDGEKKDVLFELNMPAITTAQPNASVVAALAIDYFDVVDASDHHVETTINIERSANAPVVADRPINELLELQENRMRAAEAIEEGRRLAEQGNMDSARVRLASAKAEILATSSSATPYAQQIVSELEEMASLDMASSSVFQKAGKSKMAARSMAYQQQRSNKLSYDDDVDVFETSAKKATKSAFKLFSK